MATISGNNSGSVQITSVVNTSSNPLAKPGVSYARAKTIAFVADGLKPNTKYYPFFNDVYVGHYCVSGVGATGPAIGIPANLKDTTKFIKTNPQGMLNGLFFLPAQTFTSGTQTFKLVDNYSLDTNNNLISDPLYSFAETTYETNYPLKSLQSQITDNSSTIQRNTSVTVNPSTTTVSIPSAPIYENWYFEYTVTTSKEEFVTQSTNSGTPPAIGLVQKLYGQVLNDSTVTVTYISTEAVTGGTYNHKYRVSSTNETRILRQEKTIQKKSSDAATIAALPSLTTFRPTGIGTNDIVTIKTGWTKIGPVPVPVKKGTKTPVESDSLAQSFNVDTNKYPDGMFVTAIAVYFKTVDQSTPVILELREMSNGIPNSKVLPAGSVILPGSATQSSIDATIGTIFRFDQPIFLRPSTEYCFVLKSSSMGYNVWCSRVGGVDTITGKTIDSQPFTGTLFKSDNDVTWVPDGYEDIKFDLYKASFNTTTNGTLKFYAQKNTSSNTYYSTKRVLPLSYISTTNGSSTITVKIPQHGLLSNNKIKIEGIASGTYNGITSSNLIGEFTVTTIVDEDTVKFNATSGTGSISGSIIATEPTVLYDTTQPIIAPSLPVTQAIPFIQTSNLSPATAPGATGALAFPTVTNVTPANAFTVYTNKVINEVMIDYVGTEPTHATITESLALTYPSTSTDHTRDNTISLERNGDFKSFDKAYALLTPSNEALNILTDTGSLNGKSMQATLTLSSTNKDISPVVDMNSISLTTKTFKIDNQSGEWGATGIATITNNQGYVIQTLGTTNWPSQGYEGASGVLGGTFISAATGVIPGGGYVYKISEIISGSGNAAAKYKSTINTLSTPYNALSIYVTGTCPTPAVFDVYVRTSSDQATHLDNNWVWLPSTESINNNNIFGFTGATGASKEWVYEYPGLDTSSGKIKGSSEYFTVFDIKVVMRSSNSSIVPKIYSLRTIARNIV